MAFIGLAKNFWDSRKTSGWDCCCAVLVTLWFLYLTIRSRKSISCWNRWLLLVLQSSFGTTAGFKRGETSWLGRGTNSLWCLVELLLWGPWEGFGGCVTHLLSRWTFIGDWVSFMMIIAVSTGIQTADHAPCIMCITHSWQEKLSLGSLSEKKYGIFWEFFPNVGPPPTPPIWEASVQKKIWGFILRFRP